MDIKVTRTEYQQMAETVSPKSKVLRNCVMAFLVGGAICALGQALTTLFLSFDLPEKTAKAFVSISLIALSAIMTGLKVYDKIAKHAGAGTLVPITGFEFDCLPCDGVQKRRLYHGHRRKDVFHRRAGAGLRHMRLHHLWADPLPL